MTLKVHQPPADEQTRICEIGTRAIVHRKLTQSIFETPAITEFEQTGIICAWIVREHALFIIINTV